MWNEKKQARCANLQKARNKYYRKRSSLINQQKKGNLTDKQYLASNVKISKLSGKIDSFKPLIFKCGKRYHKLSVEKTQLFRANAYLRKKIRGGKGKFTEKEKNRCYDKIGENNDRIRDLTTLQGKDFKVERGRVEVISDAELDFYQERITIWELKKEVTPSIESGDYDFVTVGEDTFPLELGKLSVIFAIDDFIEYVHNTQYERETKTPMVWVTLDGVTSTITISLDQV